MGMNVSEQEVENSFDALGQELYKSPGTAEKEKRERLDHLIHKTFVQNEYGAELLEYWKEQSLIMSPTAVPGDDPLAVGIKEGRKSVIREIIVTIRRVESS